MDSDNIAKLDKLCDDLRKRATLNRPFDAEQLIGTLLFMAESIRALAPAKAATPQPANPEVPKTAARQE